MSYRRVCLIGIGITLFCLGFISIHVPNTVMTRPFFRASCLAGSPDLGAWRALARGGRVA